ncbi:MAG: hypothetical protein HQL53_02480 [Magnetococcales bacterium]|nr:hypothetical protein [Magnetococcales bacterium]
MSSSDINKKLSAISVVEGNPIRAQLQEDETLRTPEENWKMMVHSVRQYSKAGNWSDTLDVLVFLSNQEGNPESAKARAMTMWLALKTETPIAVLTSAAYKLVVNLGEKHPLCAPLASVANLMLQHRTPEDPDRPLAISHVQQMYMHVCPSALNEDRDGFDQWVKENQLDDPDVIIPQVMGLLEIMIGDDWWVDRDAVQAELDAYQAEQQQN